MKKLVLSIFIIAIVAINVYNADNVFCTNSNLKIDDIELIAQGEDDEFEVNKRKVESHPFRCYVDKYIKLDKNGVYYFPDGHRVNGGSNQLILVHYEYKAVDCCKGRYSSCVQIDCIKMF